MSILIYQKLGSSISNQGFHSRQAQLTGCEDNLTCIPSLTMKRKVFLTAKFSLKCFSTLVWKPVALHLKTLVKAMTTLVWGRTNVSNMRASVSFEISKHREESRKYNAQWSSFDEIRGIWIADETLPRVFDISSQLKQKLKSKKRSKIIKIYANLMIGYPKLLHACDFLCLTWWIINDSEKETCKIDV